MKKRDEWIRVVMVVVLSLMLAGCTHWRQLNRKEKGAVIGAGTGAVIGSAVGGPVGTVVGGVSGGLAGGVLGSEM
jgi:uncharacterized protein YcfJ